MSTHRVNTSEPALSHQWFLWVHHFYSDAIKFTSLAQVWQLIHANSPIRMNIPCYPVEWLKAHLVCNIQRIVIWCETNVRLLLTIRPVDMKKIDMLEEKSHEGECIMFIFTEGQVVKDPCRLCKLRAHMSYIKSNKTTRLCLLEL